MANAEKQKTEQWRYCSICRRNHDEGKKHKHFKQHKNRLGQIMNKFSKKVRSARRTLTKPSVLEGELEPGAKMWCYCCEREIEKHVTDGNVSIEWGGFVEHLSECSRKDCLREEVCKSLINLTTSSSHHKKARRFWWVNGAEQSQLQAFLLFPIEYRRYKELVDEALKKLEEKREYQMRQVAEQLRVKEQMQFILAMEPPCVSTNVSIDRQREGHDHSWNQGGTSLTVSKTTKPSSAHNPSTRGNVHTGATPPWLREDDSDDGDSNSASGHVSSIGPSVEEFIKHKERLRHAGKNPRRVGADFHLKLALQGRQQDSYDDDDDDWLPSFGRVWNYGPRLHSKNEFLRELERKNKKKAGPSHTSGGSNTLNAIDQAVSLSADVLHANIKPYVRKRVMKTSNLTDSGGIVSSESEVQRFPTSFDGAPLKSDTSQSSLPKINSYIRKRVLSRRKEAETDALSNDSIKIPRNQNMEGSEVTVSIPCGKIQPGNHKSVPSPSTSAMYSSTVEFTLESSK